MAYTETIQVFSEDKDYLKKKALQLTIRIRDVVHKLIKGEKENAKNKIQ